jgi:hypothetical protein
MFLAYTELLKQHGFGLYAMSGRGAPAWLLPGRARGRGPEQRLAMVALLRSRAASPG